MLNYLNVQDNFFLSSFRETMKYHTVTTHETPCSSYKKNPVSAEEESLPDSALELSNNKLA